jgi:hypothetical protein
VYIISVSRRWAYTQVTGSEEPRTLEHLEGHRLPRERVIGLSCLQLHVRQVIGVHRQRGRPRPPLEHRARDIQGHGSHRPWQWTDSPTQRPKAPILHRFMRLGGHVCQAGPSMNPQPHLGEDRVARGGQGCAEVALARTSGTHHSDAEPSVTCCVDSESSRLVLILTS